MRSKISNFCLFRSSRSVVPKQQVYFPSKAAVESHLVVYGDAHSGDERRFQPLFHFVRFPEQVPEPGGESGERAGGFDDHLAPAVLLPQELSRGGEHLRQAVRVAVPADKPEKIRDDLLLLGGGERSGGCFRQGPGICADGIFHLFAFAALTACSTRASSIFLGSSSTALTSAALTSAAASERMVRLASSALALMMSSVLRMASSSLALAWSRSSASNFFAFSSVSRRMPSASRSASLSRSLAIWFTSPRRRSASSDLRRPSSIFWRLSFKSFKSGL